MDSRLTDPGLVSCKTAVRRVGRGGQRCAVRLAQTKAIASLRRSAMAGTRLLTVWHRHPSSPPYELLILLLAGSLALIAAHAARRPDVELERRAVPAAVRRAGMTGDRVVVRRLLHRRGGAGAGHPRGGLDHPI